MALTVADVQKIGLIARLELRDEEVAGLQDELNMILDYVEQMKELDLDGVEPTVHSAELTDSLREDVPTGSMSREAALLNAPESRDGAFVVPRIKAPGMSDDDTAAVDVGGSA